jgi:hypothetical protein
MFVVLWLAITVVTTQQTPTPARTFKTATANKTNKKENIRKTQAAQRHLNKKQMLNPRNQI